jgi:Tol biopolymer transport system component
VSPAWSPDGTKIAFISSRALNGTDAAIANRNIWIINPDGTGPQPLTRLTQAPSIDFAWSPDGKKIAFVSPRALDGSDAIGTAANIWLMNANGSGATPLTRLTTLQNMTMATPVWSPDGGRIAFVSSRALDGSDTGGSVLNIWIMNADGSNTRALTKFVAATNVQPSWSSDGSKILFSSTRALDGSDAPNTNATSNIWLMNSDGTGAKPLTKNTASDADNTGPQTSPH